MDAAKEVVEKAATKKRKAAESPGREKKSRSKKGSEQDQAFEQVSNSIEPCSLE